MLNCKRSVVEFEPKPTEKIDIHAAIVWLFLDPKNGEPYDIRKCSYDKFVEELKTKTVDGKTNLGVTMQT